MPPEDADDEEDELGPESAKRLSNVRVRVPKRKRHARAGEASMFDVREFVYQYGVTTN